MADLSVSAVCGPRSLMTVGYGLVPRITDQHEVPASVINSWCDCGHFVV